MDRLMRGLTNVQKTENILKQIFDLTSFLRLLLLLTGATFFTFLGFNENKDPLKEKYFFHPKCR